MLTLAYSLHACVLITALASLHLHTLTLAYFALDAFALPLTLGYV